MNAKLLPRDCGPFRRPLHETLISYHCPPLAISLAACNDERPEHTSDWYARNQREAQIRVDKCEMLSHAEQNQRMRRRRRWADNITNALSGFVQPVVANAGVYMIHLIGTDKYYIGSSVNMEHRFSAHRRALTKGAHHSRHLQKAWNKYGSAAFSFVPVQTVPWHNDSSDLKHRLLESEQFWFAVYSRGNGKPPAFNVSPTAGSVLGIKRPDVSARLRGVRRKDADKVAAMLCKRNSQEWMKARLRGKRTGTWAANIAAANRKNWTARAHTPETKAKIAQKLTGLKQSSETIAKRVVKLIGRGQSPESIAKRIASCAEHIPSNNTSGYRGVSWHKCKRKWLARVMINSRTYQIGLFASPEEAHVALITWLLKRGEERDEENLAVAS